nr:MAG TPA: hypothetical protein [Caudoviricetes sp.]
MRNKWDHNSICGRELWSILNHTIQHSRCIRKYVIVILIYAAEILLLIFY